MEIISNYVRVAVVLTFLIAASQSASSQTVVYVDSSATGADNGQSWTDAFRFLQDALTVAQVGEEVWVARGTYRPDQGAGIQFGDRDRSFVLSNGISMYGGFVGNETEKELRDWIANETILSGDLLQNDAGEINAAEPSRSDNANRIVRIPSGNNPRTLDGFTITSANDGAVEGNGIAILRNLLVRNSYSSRHGGGMEIRGTVSTNPCPKLSSVSFQSNVAARDGGGLYAVCESGQTLRDLTFLGNSAQLGGGLHNALSLSVFDVVFIGNFADGGGAYTGERSQLLLVNARVIGNIGLWGGGLHTEDRARLTLVNSLVAHNSADKGGGIFNLNSDVEIFNSVVASNFSVEEGGGIANWTIPSDVVQIANSIIWGNETDGSGAQFNQFDQGGGTPGPINIRSSLVEGSLPEFGVSDGQTVFDDPLFVNIVGDDGLPGTIDDDFRLQAASPAVDAGDNFAVPLDTLDLDKDFDVTESIPVDLDVNERIFDSGRGALRVDLGAYELGAPPVVLAVSGDDMLLGDVSVEAYPNPARYEITISILDNDRWPPLRLSIYDVLGRRVLTGNFSTNTNSLTVPVSLLPAGYYFALLFSKSSELVGSESFVIVR